MEQERFEYKYVVAAPKPGGPVIQAVYDPEGAPEATEAQQEPEVIFGALERWGNEGWELVSSVTMPESSGEVHYILKRPARDERGTVSGPGRYASGPPRPKIETRD